ncbi:hypothetical protein AQUCO_146700001v1 [Aquilegia coerulea]|uniref:HMA domain-containing protein n=1 Tax=Aquilegia coerulea TaxID=218851 RepID=A0A2G5C091_AQUCA|nr:hypothetical protein AQUCO_146700001v1 [Aquilegia coerulea]
MVLTLQQKVVIKISSMCCEKSRKKALKIAAIEPGVNTIGLEGDNQIIVTGEDIDAACLTLKIRKKLGWTDIISVTPIIRKRWKRKSVARKSRNLLYRRSFIILINVRDPPVDPCTIM